MKITFPEGKKVVAAFKGFTVETDQAVEDGGQNTAPSPFDLFLISIGTCAGYYVISFCQQRQIETKDIELGLSHNWNEKDHRIEEIRISIKLPPGFPEKYRKAVVRSAEGCTVKKHLARPPAILVEAIS